MGRKPKCTVEEKISAVEDYLNGIRSVSEIMVDLSIKSTRTIRDWILAYQNGGIKALCSVTANHSYSSEFKIEMVRKYINGEGSVTDLCARYGIPAHATLQKWISLYNANRELRDYDPKREVYMAEARRKTTLAERKEIVEYCITHNRDYKGTASLYDVSYSRCTHGSENMILLEKMVYPINAGTTKRMMKSMNWNGCAGRTCD